MRPWPAPVGGPRLRPCKALAALAALVALAGCDTLVVGKVDPAMFPAAAAASAPTMTGRAALDLPPAVRAHVQPGPDMCVMGRARLQLPLGAIVDAALQRQLDASFTGGTLPAALPLPAASDADVAVSVMAMRLTLDHKLNWLVPILVPVYPFVVPLSASTNYTARLELDLRVTDALGRLLAQTTVDSGSVVFERGMWSTEQADQRCLKLTHRAAWQAAEQAARVVRAVLLADRQRERAL